MKETSKRELDPGPLTKDAQQGKYPTEKRKLRLKKPKTREEAKKIYDDLKEFSELPINREKYKAVFDDSLEYLEKFQKEGGESKFYKELRKKKTRPEGYIFDSVQKELDRKEQMKAEQKWKWKMG